MLLEKIYLSFMSKLVHLECSYGVRCGAGHSNPCSLRSIIVRPSLVFLVCTHTVRKDPQLPLKQSNGMKERTSDVTIATFRL